MNGYSGGPYEQAISGTTLLNGQWYNGTQYQKYAFKKIPGTITGNIAWFVGEDLPSIMDGGATGPNGNVGAKKISQEPMSMVFNLGISSAWVEILMADLVFPTVMHIDYVLIYQKCPDMRTLFVICLVVRRRSIPKITLWRIIIRI